MNNRKGMGKRTGLLTLLLVLTLLFTGCTEVEDGLEDVLTRSGTEDTASFSLDEVPDYEDAPYVVLNDNQPLFTEKQKITSSFEKYGPLDKLGRCSAAVANVGPDLMPTEERESIGMVKPSGWHLAKYDIVSGKYLYNRCHLIGFQLTGENANKRNLITGTRYLNTEAMLPFEDLVADYVRETGNHVLYRVTPIYEGDELVARGVEMEGWSVEDEGKGVCFHIYCYNSQPGIEIDYATGESRLAENAEGSLTQDDGKEQMQGEIRGNKRSKVYHCPGQRAYEDMKDSKNLIIFETEKEAENAGYRKAKQ